MHLTYFHIPPARHPAVLFCLYSLSSICIPPLFPLHFLKKKFKILRQIRRCFDSHHTVNAGNHMLGFFPFNQSRHQPLSVSPRILLDYTEFVKVFEP